ncbi:hypothetical protein COLO4_32249 [Corchorus olitorius]|uniref:Uncharacterized protein n=1 Tax=Corchorus olitorius TaxID=93759 RepID=A0A1R3H092_9ROSI|nr:hypothetical protein COLO4_32249 [Corchorus olitorius]
MARLLTIMFYRKRRHESNLVQRGAAPPCQFMQLRHVRPKPLL